MCDFHGWSIPGRCLGLARATVDRAYCKFQRFPLKFFKSVVGLSSEEPTWYYKIQVVRCTVLIYS